VIAFFQQIIEQARRDPMEATTRRWLPDVVARLDDYEAALDNLE
jgi:hypothetical protein